jgi:hypothetical protein
MDSSVGEQPPINASDNTDYPVAKDRYGDQITYDGNPACLAGIMHDINKWIERTGNFKLLFEQYAVPLSNGALVCLRASPARRLRFAGRANRAALGTPPEA